MKKVNWEIGRRKLVCGLLVASALMAQGCATATAGAGGAGVLERAKAYWATVLANELTESWRYEEMSKDPRWTLQNFYGMPDVRNLTPELRTRGRASDEFGDAHRDGDGAADGEASNHANRY